MSSDFLPPASVDSAAPFEVSEARINYTSIALGAYVFFVIYPAYELLKYWWGSGASMLSWSSTVTALLCALFFGWNVRRKTRGLALNEPKVQQPSDAQ